MAERATTRKNVEERDAGCAAQDLLLARLRDEGRLVAEEAVADDAGLTTGDPDEAAMKRTLAGRAADTWVLAGSEKIGAASAFPVLALETVSGIVTDAPADSPVLQHQRRRGVSVLQA